jgi:hypothetical protein
MTDMASVRTALIGLISFAAAEEQMLLADVAEESEQSGNAARWAAAPLVAHITEFKRQQVWRLVAIRCGQEPPGFATIDHSSPDIYQRYRDQPADEVAMDSRRVSDDLIAAVNATSDDALTGAAGAPERQLWLQVVVRGFWHPGGHLGRPWPGPATCTHRIRLGGWPATTWPARWPRPAGRTTRPTRWPRRRT